MERLSSPIVFLTGLLVLLAVVPNAQAFKVVIAPGKTECIAETIESQHFEVIKARVRHYCAAHDGQHGRGQQSSSARQLEPTTSSCPCAFSRYLEARV
jgi:hypothetical protein